MTTSARDTLSTNVALPTEEVYPPSAAFSEQANASAALYDEAEADRLAFWATQAERLSSAIPFTRSSTGRRHRSRSGSPTASSTSPTTAWTATSTLAVALRCPEMFMRGCTVAPMPPPLDPPGFETGSSPAGAGSPGPAGWQHATATGSPSTGSVNRSTMSEPLSR